MLETFYRQLFRPGEAPPSQDGAGLIAGLILVVMTFNAASSLHTSATEVSSLLFLFSLGGFLGLFWFTAALFTLSSIWGGNCTIQTLFPAILVGLWPLIFSGTALAAQRNIPPLGALLSVAILVGTLFTLARSLATVQSISLIRSILLIFVTMILSVLAIGGVVVWPLMLLLGL